MYINLRIMYTMINVIDPRYIHVAILRVLSNIDLHYFTGPQRNKDEPKAHIVPIAYKIVNLISPTFPFESVLIILLEKKVTRQPTPIHISHPYTLVLRGKDLHKLSFLVVFSAIKRAALADAGSADPSFFLLNIFIINYNYNKHNI